MLPPFDEPRWFSDGRRGLRSSLPCDLRTDIRSQGWYVRFWRPPVIFNRLLPKGSVSWPQHRPSQQHSCGIVTSRSRSHSDTIIGSRTIPSRRRSQCQNLPEVLLRRAPAGSLVPGAGETPSVRTPLFFHPQHGRVGFFITNAAVLDNTVAPVVNKWFFAVDVVAPLVNAIISPLLPSLPHQRLPP